RGIVYKEKVWRLPIGTPTSRGKFLRNMLPLQENERITSIMPLPEDEESWGELDVMFATTRGTMRRNKLSDFTQVNRNGKIAMKFEEGSGDEILAVHTCSEDDDVLLTTALGQCIRFQVTDIRVFAGRNSTGVRGINVAGGDHVISMAILGHVEATPEERAGYLKHASALRRAEIEDEETAVTSADDEENTEAPEGDAKVTDTSADDATGSGDAESGDVISDEESAALRESDDAESDDALKPEGDVQELHADHWEQIVSDQIPALESISERMVSLLKTTGRRFFRESVDVVAKRSRPRRWGAYARRLQVPISLNIIRIKSLDQKGVICL
ncbi:MAG: hypothetical protein GY826_20815, partial [Fuerstiella sp.]|nr:hypothetical protein [Fuerstiella sp.]